MTKADKIQIFGIRCQTRIGVPDWERRRAQTLLIDVEMTSDTARAAKSDDVSLSVDYQKVEQLMRQTAQSHPRKLLETLAEDLAVAILRSERRISSILIRVHKRPKAMPGVASVAVEIRRSARRANLE